tara:strand:+ start:54 stop:773 length:720 start_codon:yes stop_codon:yes gene_type:complete
MPNVRNSGEIEYYRMNNIGDTNPNLPRIQTIAEYFGTGNANIIGPGYPNSFYLSDLVNALKEKNRGREIHLHLICCLATPSSVNLDPIEPDDLSSVTTQNWVEMQNNSCGELPRCSLELESIESIDTNDCPDGTPKHVTYEEISGNDDEVKYMPVLNDASTCRIRCAPGYREVDQENNVKEGVCLSYTSSGVDGGYGEYYTRFLNNNSNTLSDLNITCVRDENICNRLRDRRFSVARRI